MFALMVNQISPNSIISFITNNYDEIIQGFILIFDEIKHFQYSFYQKNIYQYQLFQINFQCFFFLNLNYEQNQPYLLTNIYPLSMFFPILFLPKLFSLNLVFITSVPFYYFDLNLHHSILTLIKSKIYSQFLFNK